MLHGRLLPIVLIGLVSPAILVTAYAHADTIHVPGDYPTIQAGIDAAVDGDEVVVADGVYTGPGNRDIDFNGKLITVRSKSGPANCIIDCEGSRTEPHRGFHFHSGEPPAAVVDGFTIRGGWPSYDMDWTTRGGGIRCDGSSPTIMNCIIADNIVFSVFGAAGGGMYSAGGSPTIINCTIIGNKAWGGEFGAVGGGICCFGGAPTIVNSAIMGNLVSALLGSGGGGVYLSVGSALVLNCTFSGNHAAIGGGLRNYSGSLTLINCTFNENGYSGFSNADTAQVINCTFSENEFTGLDNAGTAQVINCILWGNGGNEIFDYSGGATVSYSDVEGGWPGTGNIDADPLFVDPDNGDYRLQSGSPCADAGNNWGVPTDDSDYDVDGNTAELFPVDLDGNPRFNADEADFDPGCGVPVVVDMGAYEFQFDPVDQVIFADLNADRVVGILDLLGVLTAWGDATNNCLADLDIDGTVGILDLLTLLGNWGP